ncbi:MAG: hypothetical protein H6626_10875 [Pseudobdellovibrionaceae bacterium]|nr:MAG: hypothetical protein H6626_10875 [Pseudobdellovibrionaceae bacterium]
MRHLRPMFGILSWLGCMGVFFASLPGLAGDGFDSGFSNTSQQYTETEYDRAPASDTSQSQTYGGSYNSGMEDYWHLGIGSDSNDQGGSNPFTSIKNALGFGSDASTTSSGQGSGCSGNTPYSFKDKVGEYCLSDYSMRKWQFCKSKMGEDQIFVTDNGGEGTVDCGLEFTDNGRGANRVGDDGEGNGSSETAGQCATAFNEAKDCCTNPTLCLGKHFGMDDSAAASKLNSLLGVGTAMYGASGGLNNACDRMSQASAFTAAVNAATGGYCVKLRNDCVQTCNDQQFDGDEAAQERARKQAVAKCEQLDNFIEKAAVFGIHALTAYAQSNQCSDASASVAGLGSTGSVDYGKPDCNDPAQASNPLCRNCSGPNAAKDPACAGILPSQGSLNARSGVEDKDGLGDGLNGFDSDLFTQGVPGGGPGAKGNKAVAGEASGGGLPGGGGAAGGGAGTEGQGGGAGSPKVDGNVRYSSGGGGSFAGGSGYVSSSGQNGGRGGSGKMLGNPFNLSKYLPGQKGKKLDPRLGARGLAGMAGGGIGKVTGNIWLSVSKSYKSLCARNQIYDCKGQ